MGVVHAQLDVREDIGSVSQARRFVRAQLSRWSISSQVIGDALVVASELVTNALRHGLPPRRLELELSAGRLYIAVRDTGPGRPQPRPAASAGESGRGLALVEALGSDWGTDARPAAGKRVWCELSLPGGGPNQG